MSDEAIVEAAGPECLVPGQITPIKLLGLKVPFPFNFYIMICVLCFLLGVYLVCFWFSENWILSELILLHSITLDALFFMFKPLFHD